MQMSRDNDQKGKNLLISKNRVTLTKVMRIKGTK